MSSSAFSSFLGAMKNVLILKNAPNYWLKKSCSMLALDDLGTHRSYGLLCKYEINNPTKLAERSSKSLTYCYFVIDETKSANKCYHDSEKTSCTWIRCREKTDFKENLV